MPSISGVTWYSAAQQVVIVGSASGTRAPYNGDSAFIKIVDLSENSYEEGNTGNPFGLHITSWTDGEIVISGWTVNVPLPPFNSFPFAIPGHVVKLTCGTQALISVILTR